MSITSDGIEGEKIARDILKQNGFNVFGGDWIAQNKNGDYFLIEVKNKELYNPPPFLGTGLNIYQVIARQKFKEKTGIRTILFTRDKEKGICYWQFLDVLEQGEKHDTKNKIRIYRITNFESFKQIGDTNESKN